MFRPFTVYPRFDGEIFEVDLKIEIEQIHDDAGRYWTIGSVEIDKIHEPTYHRVTPRVIDTLKLEIDKILQKTPVRDIML